MLDNWKSLGCWIAVLCFIFPYTSHSKGVSPYLPVNLAPALENEIERLAVVAGIPNLTKPYSLATIFQYMEQIRDSHPALYSRLSLSLKRYGRKFGVTHWKLTASYSDESHPIANGRGNYTDAIGSLSFRGQWQMADWFALYAGVHASEYRGDEDDDGDNPDDVYQTAGSTISFGVDWAQLDIGYRDIWLSPFQGSAQLLSTQAEAMPSISLSNNLPIEFLGVRWNYQGFLAEMSRQQVFFDGSFSDEDPPLLAGVHISMQPTPWWSIGATRMFQFGGGERPVDFETLIRAFFDPRGADNEGTSGLDENNESGNQIASLSSKINFDGRLPFSFAVELAGEDTSNNKNYQLGNTSLTAGLYFPFFFSEALSLTYEYADWQDAWYVNSLYSEGYTNEGFVLGHWAMQIQRDTGTAVEGTSHFLKTQWQTPKDHILSAVVRLSDHEDTNQVEFQEAWELDIEYLVPWGSHIVSFGAHIGENNFGDEFSQIKLSLEW